MTIFSKQTAKQQSFTLLLVGAAVGILMAVSGPYRSLTHDNTVVAWVNGTAIGKIQYIQALELLSLERRSPINDQDRSLILNRLIEEELLVQKAIQDGALRNDFDVRQRTLQTMLDSIQSESIARHGNDGESSYSAVADYIEQLRDDAAITWIVEPTTETPATKQVAQ